MFEKMMSLLAGNGRGLEEARNEPSHIHIQRPSRAAAFEPEKPSHDGDDERVEEREALPST